MSQLRLLRASCLALLPLLALGCDSGRGEGRTDDPSDKTPPPGDGDGDNAGPRDATWLAANTLSLRHRLSLPGANTRLQADALIKQLQVYDPGSLIRCAVVDDPAYREVVDKLGGVRWGYPVSVLEDMSKPELRLGPLLLDGAPDSAGGTAGEAVEIEKADIVGLSETAALYFSQAHGLLFVDLSEATPRFKCAAKLPGDVRDFYYYQDHLVAMTGANLLHFKLSAQGITFVEHVALDGPVLDTRRFNDRLVVYSSLRDVAEDTSEAKSRARPKEALASAEPWYQPPAPHRDLRVFRFGETLREELHHTLLDTTKNDSYLQTNAVTDDTAPGSLVYSGTSYGETLSASDRYFVVTQRENRTYFTNWETRTYPVCTQGHTKTIAYQACTTTYETRPNPAYTPPDNSGGDRACKGTSLADCLRTVARVSNKTIQVPVRTECAPATREEWVCDVTERRSYRYANFRRESDTRLTIYEYTDDGFVRLDDKVHSITNEGLEERSLAENVETLTTSDEAFDLLLPGSLQTVYFQGGFMYAISDGTLQIYAIEGSSLVRTSELQVAGNQLQSSLFSDNKLYLSDYKTPEYGQSDYSTLRVIDLENPAFPRKLSSDQRLPGTHTTILATNHGILTVGSVKASEDPLNSDYWLKLGLFADPVTTEKAYLILGTDLDKNRLEPVESQYFNRAANRLFVPYRGVSREESELLEARIGVSRVEPDEIVSEGALALHESATRVRARPGTTDQLLAFGESSINWLTRAAPEWQATPLLAYYSPIALYRLSEQDDYLEVLRLGSSCKLRFVKQSQLNERTADGLSEAFPCATRGYPWAYDHNIVFGATTGVRFDDDGTLELLEPAEIAELFEKRAQRRVCLFSDEPTHKPFDPHNPPPLEQLRCYSQEEYQTLVYGTAN